MFSAHLKNLPSKDNTEPRKPRRKHVWVHVGIFKTVEEINQILDNSFVTSRGWRESKSGRTFRYRCRLARSKPCEYEVNVTVEKHDDGSVTFRVSENGRHDCSHSESHRLPRHCHSISSTLARANSTSSNYSANNNPGLCERNFDMPTMVNQQQQQQEHHQDHHHNHESYFAIPFIHQNHMPVDTVMDIRSKHKPQSADFVLNSEPAVSGYVNNGLPRTELINVSVGATQSNANIDNNDYMSSGDAYFNSSIKTEIGEGGRVTDERINMKVGGQRRSACHFRLSDGESIAQLLQVATEMDLMFTFNARRSGEYCFERNGSAFGRMVVFADMGEHLRVSERIGPEEVHVEIWTKADWLQFLWAVRGKCRKALKDIA